VEGIDGYGGKDFEKRKVLIRDWKTPGERSTSGPESEHDDGEELGDDKQLIIWTPDSYRVCDAAAFTLMPCRELLSSQLMAGCLQCIVAAGWPSELSFRLSVNTALCSLQMFTFPSKHRRHGANGCVGAAYCKGYRGVSIARFRGLTPLKSINQKWFNKSGDKPH